MRKNDSNRRGYTIICERCQGKYTTPVNKRIDVAHFKKTVKECPLVLMSSGRFTHILDPDPFEVMGISSGRLAPDSRQTASRTRVWKKWKVVKHFYPFRIRKFSGLRCTQRYQVFKLQSITQSYQYLRFGRNWGLFDFVKPGWFIYTTFCLFTFTISQALLIFFPSKRKYS